MKKNIILAVAASLAVSTTTALAAPGAVTFDGSLTMQYGVVDHPNSNASNNGLNSTFTLNTTVNVAENLDAYARLTYQALAKDLKGTTFHLYQDGTNAGNVDGFGLKYSNAGYKYTIGSQALTIGSGLIYDNGFIGNHTLPYAAVISKKVGATDLTAFYARTNYQSSRGENDKFYGLQGTYTVNDKFTVGGMFTSVKYGQNNGYVTTTNSTSQNFYELSGSYQITPKVGLSVAYAKSNAPSDNHAYSGSVGYKFDNKNKLGISYYKSEDLSNINDNYWGGMTTTPNANTQGVSISYNHVINKNLSSNVSRSMYSAINPSTVGGDAHDRVKTQATVTYSF